MESEKVKNLDESLQLCDRTSEVEYIRDIVGDEKNRYEAFFVKGSGEYDEIWGITNQVPYSELTAYKLK
jgi:hypothetical protein